MATGGNSPVSTADNRVVADTHDRVTHHLFGAGLTLASIVVGQRVDDETAHRLVDVIDQLDRGVQEIRRSALIRAIADRDTARSETSQAAAPATVMPDPDTDGHARRGVRRRLRRVEDAAVFAYALRGHDFFRTSDHQPWAHERDGLLLSARSGMPLARRVGDVFYAPDADIPLYYEDHARRAPLPVAARATAPGARSFPTPTTVEEVVE